MGKHCNTMPNEEPKEGPRVFEHHGFIILGKRDGRAERDRLNRFVSWKRIDPDPFLSRQRASST
ncbi:hypothetical protein EFR01_60290 [Sinorhizobium fredii]|nr:hypothetical protein EFR01_60290 [Sinorhizobium fredii]GLS10230.1 hypothetical protein GCM10007864_38610 [Sinorhizobium fredii]CEO91472.1 hypothetical protein SFHH103_psfHH103d_274 [Sinorhizobium fredii HH103]